MKPALILAAILASAVAIGSWQYSRLHQLKCQANTLENLVTQPVAIRSTRSTESAPATPSVSQEIQDKLREEIVTVILARMDRSQNSAPDQAERWRNMLLTGAKFNAADIGRFMQKLMEDPRLTGLLNEGEIIQICLRIFPETGPVAAMRFMEGHRDMSGWNANYFGCFSSFLRANPRDAIRWFDEQSALGNPDVANANFRQSILIREARVDPDRMLARAMTPEFASDPEIFSHLGGFVASSLKEPSEHQRFLTALSRRQRDNDPSSGLAKIRAEYLAGLSQLLAEFTFEDTSVLIDSEFTHDEKLSSVATLSNRGDLSDPAKWADWLLKIDSQAWENWKAAKGTKDRYPATAVLSNWARQDNQAAGKWLENVPDGPLKADMSLEYAWIIAGIDPLRAATYLPQLAVGKGKTNLVKKIAKTLDSKDPSAAAAFRREFPASP
jgi:hypothetical protein